MLKINMNNENSRVANFIDFESEHEILLFMNKLYTGNDYTDVVRGILQAQGQFDTIYKTIEKYEDENDCILTGHEELEELQKVGDYILEELQEMIL